MKRFYYLSKDIECVKAISDDLHQGGVTDWNFHVVAKDAASLYAHNLHGSGPLQCTDFTHWALRGALFGLTVSVCSISLLSWQSNYPDGPMLAGAILLTMFSTWVGGLIGFSHVHYKIARYYGRLEAGEYLMIVDIPIRNAQWVEELIELHHRGEAQKVDESSRFDNPFESGPLLAYP